MSILTKRLPVMRVVRGLQTIILGKQGLSTIIERSMVGEGYNTVMGINRYDKLCGRQKD